MLRLTLETPRTAACQSPLSMGFPRQEYWNGLPFPFPRDLPNLGTEPVCPADSLPLNYKGSPDILVKHLLKLRLKGGWTFNS